jgi:hypothetical protein
MEGFSTPWFTKRRAGPPSSRPIGLQSRSSALPGSSVLWPQKAPAQLCMGLRDLLSAGPRHAGLPGPHSAGLPGHHSIRPPWCSPAGSLLHWAPNLQTCQDCTLQACQIVTLPGPCMAYLPDHCSARPPPCKDTGPMPASCPPQEGSKPT